MLAEVDLTVDEPAETFHCGWSKCEATFTVETDLTAHLSGEHLSYFPYRCVECGCRCATQYTLDGHFRSTRHAPQTALLTLSGQEIKLQQLLSLSKAVKTEEDEHAFTNSTNTSGGSCTAVIRGGRNSITSSIKSCRATGDSGSRVSTRMSGSYTPSPMPPPSTNARARRSLLPPIKLHSVVDEPKEEDMDEVERVSADIVKESPRATEPDDNEEEPSLDDLSVLAEHIEFARQKSLKYEQKTKRMGLFASSLVRCTVPLTHKSLLQKSLTQRVKRGRSGITIIKRVQDLIGTQRSPFTRSLLQVVREHFDANLQEMVSVIGHIRAGCAVAVCQSGRRKSL